MTARVVTGGRAPTWRLAGGVTVICTTVADGDLARPGPARHAVRPGPWTTLRQVHGARVVSVRRPGDGAGEAADAAVTASAGPVLAVLTADCAPVALASAEGVVGVVHAGWRGVLAGVVEATVEAMRALGATAVEGVVGPCIHAECYEFGPADLDRLAAAYGPAVRARHGSGRPALDLPAAVAAALGRAGAALVACSQECTACSGRYWSWRARQDQGRQATLVWRS